MPQFRNIARATGIALGGALVVRSVLRLLVHRRMEHQAIFITGGSRGLGFAIALECARRGANVAVCARSADDLERAAERLRACGGQVLAFGCDVTDRGQIGNAIRQAFETFGRLDVVVNNAGTIAVGPMEAMTREDYAEALNTHFWAMYYAVEASRPLFERQGAGRILNIVSIGGKISVPHLLPYSVSKFAAAGYSEGLRAALHRSGIIVTTVCPGLMRTGSPRNAWFKAQHKKEYAWFALSDTLPGLSMPATSAARQTLDACLRGDAEVVLSLPAQAIALAHGIAPGLTARLMQLAADMLPADGGVGTRRMKGSCSESALTRSPLTALGRKAERKYNQI